MIFGRFAGGCLPAITAAIIHCSQQTEVISVLIFKCLLSLLWFHQVLPFFPVHTCSISTSSCDHEFVILYRKFPTNESWWVQCGWLAKALFQNILEKKNIQLAGLVYSKLYQFHHVVNMLIYNITYQIALKLNLAVKIH